MRNHYEALLLLSALLALGCGGNAVDVGHSQQRGWSDAPAKDAKPAIAQTIYESDEAMFGFTLDDDTLYALIAHNDTFELVSCPLERCRSERSVLYSGPWLDQPSPLSTPLIVSGGWLYWVVANGGPNGIAACPKTGCAAPRFVPTQIRSRVTGDTKGGAYWIDNEMSLMRIAADADAPEPVRVLAGEALDPQHLCVRDDYVYFNDQGGASSSSIRRLPVDGSSASELVATDDMITGFAVTADALYYPSQILTGHIIECPLPGCQAGGRTLVANQRWPEGVQVHGNQAFWVNNQRFSERGTLAALATCVLPDCASVKELVLDFPVHGIVDYQHEGAKFAVGSRAVVWLERFHGIGSSLRRLAR
jgi:hypothetical protein